MSDNPLEPAFYALMGLKSDPLKRQNCPNYRLSKRFRRVEPWQVEHARGTPLTERDRKLLDAYYSSIL